MFQAPGIEAHVPSLEQLLAMKLSAWRDDVDISDARRLLREVVGGRQREEVWQKLEPYRVALPVDVNVAVAQLFVSNVRLALAILRRPQAREAMGAPAS